MSSKDLDEEPIEASSRGLHSHSGLNLQWSNVSMSVMVGKNEEKCILKDVWGCALASETTAIMGATGSGKTSLLNVLNGRAVSRNLQVETEVFLAGNKIDVQKKNKASTQILKQFAFVAQEDSLHAVSTPREALRFSAKLRLPRSTTHEEIEDVVTKSLEQLGLIECADTRIGGGLVKGLSGGERKRTSIGVELVVHPAVIFLDEPSSGLDSFSAEQTMFILQRLAKKTRATVVFTVHQPSQDVFQSFDRLILLSHGRLLYQGAVKDIHTDLRTLGYPIPEGSNPAEWIMKVALSKPETELEAHGFFPKCLMGPPKVEASLEQILVAHAEGRISLFTELLVLTQREVRSLLRNKSLILTNVAITAAFAIIYGIFFLNVGRTDSSDLLNVQAHLGALVNIMITTMMGQSTSAAMAFPMERPLFLREYYTGHYLSLTYLLSHLATEAVQVFIAILVQSAIVYPMIGLQMDFVIFFIISYALALTSTSLAVFLGACFSDLAMLMNWNSIAIVPQFYFSGVFLPTDLLPDFVQWAQYLCSLRYAAGLLMIYEFGDCEEGPAQENCEKILERNHVDESDQWFYWLVLLILVTVFRVAALIVLQRKANHYW